MFTAIMLVDRDILDSSRYAPKYQRKNIGSVIKVNSFAFQTIFS